MNVEEYIASLNLDGEAKKKATEGLKNFLKDNYVEKAKFDEAATAKSNLETQIKERDKQLETLKRQLAIRKNLKLRLNSCRKITNPQKQSTKRI